MFLISDGAALDVVDAWRGIPGLRMIEYFDANSLDFLRPHYPEIPNRAAAALLIEQEDGDIDFWADHAPEDSWFAASDQDRERFRRFRHALPELVNDTMRRRGFMKLGSDYAVPLARNREMLAFYHAELMQHELEYVIFGHIGDAHVHVNILPKSQAEFEDGPAFDAPLRASRGRAGRHGLGRARPRQAQSAFARAAIHARADRKHEGGEAAPGSAVAAEPGQSVRASLAVYGCSVSVALPAAPL